MRSLSKKNFDSPLVFAMQTFQQLNFSDMMFWGKEFQICLHKWQWNVKFEHVFFYTRKLKDLVNCRGQTISADQLTQIKWKYEILVRSSQDSCRQLEYYLYFLI